MNTLETVKQCIVKGIGITIMPEISARKEIFERELTVLPWTDETLETAILMIWHKNKWISPSLQAFMNTVREVVCDSMTVQDKPVVSCGHSNIS